MSSEWDLVSILKLPLFFLPFGAPLAIPPAPLGRISASRRRRLPWTPSAQSRGPRSGSFAPLQTAAGGRNRIRTWISLLNENSGKTVTAAAAMTLVLPSHLSLLLREFLLSARLKQGATSSIRVNRWVGRGMSVAWWVVSGHVSGDLCRIWSRNAGDRAMSNSRFGFIRFKSFGKFYWLMSESSPKKTIF